MYLFFLFVCLVLYALEHVLSFPYILIVILVILKMYSYGYLLSFPGGAPLPQNAPIIRPGCLPMCIIY
jgi:hypothetical protein